MKLPVFISSLNQPVHPSWKVFLTDDILQKIELIEKEVQKSSLGYTPPPPLVLRFLQIPLEKVNIIILGQDPYPQKGVATGRAFEVGSLKKWEDKFSNVSLKNIVRSICKAYTGKILKYSEIIRHPPDGFKILSPDKLFYAWEKQGVLLLNTSFTVETGKPGSHAGLWNDFTLELLNFLAREKPGLIWFLWGNHARQIANRLPLKNILASQHPMMCYNGPDRKDDFLFGEINHFYETKHMVDWRGREEDN